MGQCRNFTAIGANKYTVSRLYVSKDNINSAIPVYFSVLGDAQYNNLVQAQTAIANGAIPAASGELRALEIAQLGYIIFEESSTSIVDVIIAKETLTSVIVLGGTNQASLVLTDTTNFDHILSAANTNVQSSLETIDDLILRGDAASDAQASSAVFTIAGGTGITTTGAASTVTIDLDSPVSATNGGTGVADPTDHSLLVGSGAGAMTELGVATNGQIPIGSTGADPVLAAPTNGTNITWTTGAGTLQADLTATIAVSLGGTGVVDPTDHSLVVGSGAAAMTELGVATNGQLVIGSTGADPVLATPTNGTNITWTTEPVLCKLI